MIKDLTVGKPQTVLLKFTLPLFGSIIFQQLYNIADSFVAGKFVSENALAAVGNSYEITLIYIAFAFGCNVGCSVVISQLFGAKRYREMKSAISTAMIASGILCLILMAFGLCLGGNLLSLIHTPENIFSDSLLYLNIYTGGLLFLFYYNIATGIFSALGDSKTPFFFLAVSSVSNIFVDILFVTAFDMGIAGVAWATFLCQGVSGLAALFALFTRLKTIGSKNEPFAIFSFTLFKRIVMIAVPSILQQSFISIGNIILQGIINGFGSAVVAGYSAAIKLNNFAVTSFTTLGNGMSNFTAQNVGANKEDRVKEGLKGGLYMSGAIAIIFAALYLLFSKEMIELFMSNGSDLALNTGITFLSIVSPFYLFPAIKLMCDGLLRGAGAMKPFMLATFTDLILRVALSFVLSARFGSNGIWFSWPIGWSIASVMSVFFYVKGYWKKSSSYIN